MNRSNALKLAAIIVVSMLSSCNLTVTSLSNNFTEMAISHTESRQFPKGVVALLNAYPDFVKSYRNNYIFFADGDSLIYDDNVEKDFIEKLDNPDIEDMFCQTYSKDSIPQYLHDAGRIRSDSFFRKMYGNSQNEVLKKLVSVDWFGQTIKFSSLHYS